MTPNKIIDAIIEYAATIESLAKRNELYDDDYYGAGKVEGKIEASREIIKWLRRNRRKLTGEKK